MAAAACNCIAEAIAIAIPNHSSPSLQEDSNQGMDTAVNLLGAGTLHRIKDLSTWKAGIGPTNI